MGTDVSGLKFAETHEWISVQSKTGVVGISDHAQKEISDVVFVELPKTGRKVKKGEACAVVESVKAAFDIYAPVSGTIKEVNQALVNSPQTVNASPYKDGWFFKMDLDDPKEADSLMDAKKYDTFKLSAHH